MNFDDPGYDEFVAGCVEHCRCCPCCWGRPCAGAMAGGICDEMNCLREGEQGDVPDLFEETDS